MHQLSPFILSIKSVRLTADARLRTASYAVNIRLDRATASKKFIRTIYNFLYIHFFKI